MCVWGCWLGRQDPENRTDRETNVPPSQERAQEWGCGKERTENWDPCSGNWREGRGFMTMLGCHVIITVIAILKTESMCERHPPSQTRRSVSNRTDVCKAPWGPPGNVHCLICCSQGRGPPRRAPRKTLQSPMQRRQAGTNLPGCPAGEGGASLPTIFFRLCQRSPLQTGGHVE